MYYYVTYPHYMFPWNFRILNQQFFIRRLHGFFALAGIKQELEELLGCKVDIVRLRDKMDSFLRERIKKEGIYV